MVMPKQPEMEEPLLHSKKVIIEWTKSPENIIFKFGKEKQW